MFYCSSFLFNSLPIIVELNLLDSIKFQGKGRVTSKLLENFTAQTDFMTLKCKPRNLDVVRLT